MTKSYSTSELASIIEALIFAAEQPLTVNEIIKTIALEIHSSISSYSFYDNGGAPLLGNLEDQNKTTISIEEEATGGKSLDLQQAAIRSQVYQALDLLKQAYSDPKRQLGLGFVLEEVAGGWSFRSHPKYAGFIRRQQQIKPQRLSKAAMENLAIIAYQQPITKPQIDAIRGVDSGGVIRALLERGLVRVVGRREEPGRPLLYGTTPGFLSLFNLNGLSDLPALSELEELNSGLPPENTEQYSNTDLIDQVTTLKLDLDQDDLLLNKVDEAITKLRSKTQSTMELVDPDNFANSAKK